MYATAADLIEQYDARVIGDYASDDGTTVPPGSLAANDRVLNALRGASAKINAACQRGKRYSTATLAALAADEDKGALLRNMTCAFAMAQLVSARLAGAKIEEVVFGYKEAEETLAELRGGAQTFDVEENLTAGVPLSVSGPASGSDLSRPTIWNPLFGTFPTGSNC